MKLSAQEEYGLRCLLRMARSGEGGSTTISEISESEGLSRPHIAKLMRLLRLAGFVESVRGQAGGYKLARPASLITVGDALEALGGRFFGPDFCRRYAGDGEVCVHWADCSIRSLLAAVQTALDHLLHTTTLQDLLCDERKASARIAQRVALPKPAAEFRAPVGR